MQKYKLGKHEVRVCGKAVETDAGIELVHSGSFIEFYGEIGKVSMKISGNADESDFAAYVGVFLNEGDTPENTRWAASLRNLLDIGEEKYSRKSYEIN